MFLIPHLKVKSAKHKGRGVFTTRDIEAGTVVADYLGKLVRSGDVKEGKDGHYDMAYNETVSIIPDPKKIGAHLINHSCEPNCDTYPLKNHALIFALRKIFSGEELTYIYNLDPLDEKKCKPCRHSCRCGSVFCRGTLHLSVEENKRINAFNKKHDDKTDLPVKYGCQLPPLSHYPAKVIIKDPAYDTIFGCSKKPPFLLDKTVLPSFSSARRVISETGLAIAYPRINLIIVGILNGYIVVQPYNKKDGIFKRS